jgi:hypothetical protein
MNLKKIIKEEIEDFTWMIDEPLNPWDEYDMIIFDQKPTKKEINNYIELALNTKNPKNKNVWEIGGEKVRKEDIESILKYIKRYGGAVLNVDEYKDLVYSDPSYYENRTFNSIKYSQLVNKKINESKEDDFGWVREVTAELPRNEEDLKNFIGWSFLYDRSLKGIWYYDGATWKITKVVDGEVYYYNEDDKTNHQSTGNITTGNIIEYINQGVYVLVSPDGKIFDPLYNRTYTPKINESEDLKWIQDIEPDLKVKINDLREGLRVKINTNKEDYGVFFRNDLHYYMEQSGGGEGTVRYWSTPDGNNTWVTVEWDNGLRDTYRNTYPLHEEYDIYSLLMVIDQPLTESEEDDWAWARGPIWVDEVNKGNRIRVHNKGDEDAFINWLGMYSDDYIAGDFGENIEGIVSGVADDEFWLDVVSRGSGFEQSIYFPYKKHMEYIGMSTEDYNGLNLEYELIP